MREEKEMVRPEGERPGAAFSGAFSDGERGFSLVEVTLALLVVAVGMTAAFSLFPEAIRSTRASVSNTETALFADYVFSTLELEAGYTPVAVSNYSDVEPNDLPEDSYEFRSDAFSRNAARKNFEIVQSSKAETFCWIPDNYGINGAEEMSRSLLQGKMKTSTFTYQLTLKKKDDLGGSPIIAVLKVWPGEYEGLNPKSEEAKETARVFYREILPPK